ncbi:MAG: hydrogen peroxide-inducible genes activator [Bacteroidota bacterium]|nr:hydrogen peroxide-inducible genes activator [Bacteroidota bacterium]MDP4205145.1 hydrogen peroxide-inducible genes activator [Bacteroidota bacterium]
MITLTQLEYIVAVDQCRHYGKAAEKCFITQPTLSMQIKKLEDDLGVTIFDRNRQPLVPTEIGIEIIEQARKALREAEQINLVIEEHKHFIGGTLRLGIIPTLSPYLLPLFIGSLKRDYPRLNIKVEELFTDKIIEALRKDAIDIGILVTPLHEEKIIERPLFYEEMKVYTHPDHPLSHHKTLRVQDVSLSDIWLLSDGHCFRNQVINLCKAKGTHKNRLPFEFEAGSMETLIKIVDNEGGITLIPELAMNDMNENRRKNVKDFEGLKPLREVSLVYSEFYGRKKIIEILEKEIIKNIPSYLLEKERGMIVEWR